MSDEQQRRGRTPYHRDVYRPKTPPGGGEPEFVCEDITSQYEGDELRAKRAKRPTKERIGRLETKHDELAQVVTEMRVEVASMSGKLDVLPRLVDAVQSATEQAASREQSKREDDLDERKNTRERVTKVIAFVLGGGFLMELIHRLASL